MTIRAAIYARFSTEQQSADSIDDQYRVCERHAERNSLNVIARFNDEAISGGTAQRPGYQAMLAAARRHEFDVIVAEDLKRLWREQAEQWRAIKELLDLGIHVVTVSGIDSRQPNFEIIASVIGAAGELERKEAAYRTRRGLEGKALAGESTGGRAFGYVPARDSESGHIEVNAAEAATVRRIFELYADGMSPRSIAALFNEEGVPSPGATWRRTERRTDRKWLASTIHGDAKRGTGILNNRRYTGVIAWGRSKWTRGAADSKVRRFKMLAEGSAHEKFDERLRIISDELWQRVKARQGQRTKDLGVKVVKGLRRHVRPVKYLLSGLLRCAACEASFVLSNGSRYQCASHVNGDACEVTLSLPRERAERIILDCVQGELLTEERLGELERRYRSVAERPAVDHSLRIAELDKEIGNLGDAIAKGLLSDALAKLLQAAEAERGRLIAATAKGASGPIWLPKATLERRVQDMRKRLAEGGEVARSVLRDVLPGGIWLEKSGTGKFLYANFNEGVWTALHDGEPDVLDMFPIVRDDPAEEKSARMVAGARSFTHRLTLAA